jgi:hypothetical protein
MREVHGIGKNQVGEVLWHSLRENGEIRYYDIKFGRQILRNVPTVHVVPIYETVQEHEHEAHEER